MTPCRLAIDGRARQVVRCVGLGSCVRARTSPLAARARRDSLGATSAADRAIGRLGRGLTPQEDLVEAVDVTTAQKAFDLQLPELGPYSVDYTSNGDRRARRSCWTSPLATAGNAASTEQGK